MSQYPVTGAGLGLRRAFLYDFLESVDRFDTQGGPKAPDFLEVAPENWIGLGGRKQKAFAEICERFPMVTHGLSLSLGGPDPLDFELLSAIKTFCKQYNIRKYTEHLSYCSGAGHLYDLMPIPFTDEAVDYVADRIRQVQDFLEQRIAIENVSFYAAPGAQMSELEFITSILDRVDCDFLLDVNNIYVNSINHQYDPYEFLKALPSSKVSYVHVAGHYDEADDLKVDTHGSDVKTEVWDLLNAAYQQHGLMPTLLERDFNIPALSELFAEVQTIRQCQQAVTSAEHKAS